MKGNSKKLAVFVMIAAIAIFIAAATASARDRDDHRIAIQGQYAATGGGTCLAAFSGFDQSLIPTGPYSLMTFSMEAVFTFKPDGTGEVSRTLPTIVHQLPPYAEMAMDSWDFTYELASDGSITLTQVPGSYTGEFTSGPLTPPPFHYSCEHRDRRGTVSPDGKTIILNGGLPDFVTDPAGETFQMICNDSAVLIWQHDIHRK